MLAMNTLRGMYIDAIAAADACDSSEERMTQASSLRSLSSNLLKLDLIHRPVSCRPG